ncbi:tRNA (32-2'-O)-methyltransferase regulator THADA-like [Rhinophrynus dorsalis]
MEASFVFNVQEMLQNAGHCVLFYQNKGLDALKAVALQLQKFAEASVKRCKDKHLEDAAQLLAKPEEVVGTLCDTDLLPLIHCILSCQTGTCNSSSSFQRLEKVLQLKDLQTVCMYLEGSSAGRKYFRQYLHSLLSSVSATFSAILQDHTKQRVEHCYLTVKICLLLFRELKEDIAPFVWTPCHCFDAFENILGSLVIIITAQDASQDTRLLAGTTLASLANTAHVAASGAQAALSLVQQVRQDLEANVFCFMFYFFMAGPGKVTFGELSVFFPDHPMDDVGLIAMVRGLLTCGRSDLLTCTHPASGQNLSTLELLLPSVTSLCEGKTELYYSFQVLCLWLQRVHEQVFDILKVREEWLLANVRNTISHIAKLLWTGAEMPVDGLSDLVLSSFQHYLHINRIECQLMGSSEETLLQEILRRIKGISWQSRSKYIPLCALIPFLGPERVLDLYPQLPAHLFCCLSVNYLCPPASETYRTLLTLQREQWSQNGQLDEKVLAERWAMTWLSPLCDALCSTESSLQSNAATLFLPCSLRCFPESSSLLAERLHGLGPSELRGWVSLIHAQKAILGRVTWDIREKLQLCLESTDDGVRLSALSFLCCSPRSSQPPLTQDLELLKKFLPYNMGCDSPGFRQQLQAVLRKAIERLRDGALSALRRKHSKEEDLSQSIGFLNWLHHLSISSISPAGNYQRRCSGLLTLRSLLESCTDCWSPQRKKGQPPEDISLLLNYARQRGSWDFFSSSNMQALLGCMQDSTNEIREMASDLLVRFFPPAPEPLSFALFELGQSSVCSPRVPLAESGALIMKTLLQRPDGALLFPGDSSLTALNYVTSLTKTLHEQYCHAQENLLLAANSTPLHGVLSALRLCFMEVPSVSQSLSHADFATSWRYLLQDLVSTLREIASFILRVLYGAQLVEPSELAAPSYADMGKAVSALIAQGHGLEEVQGAVLLSEEHSLIMTCCWVSLKEIGVLLGPLVEKLLSGHVTLLPPAAVQESVATYQDIFLRCRHWGAVDGCSAGFTKLCSALLCHEDPKLRNVPRQMMEQALERCRSQQSLSVTRRAAGFPVLLQCILCAEGTQHPLLASCVHSLLELAQEPLPSNWDQTRDLPQVSAVHALQNLFRSAGLRSTLLTHAVPMMSLAVRTLRSPCWAMRNAALQLFSVLAGGMLGLSRSDGDGSVQSTLNVESLLRRFPGLEDVLLQELSNIPHEGMTLQPSLHPPLTLLAKLQPGGHSVASCFLEPLLELAENPIHAVRAMAARALVPIVQVADYHTLILQLVGKLPDSNKEVCHNTLHGRLLQIHALLVPALKEECLTGDVGQGVAQKLIRKLWLLSPEQKCPLVRVAFLDNLTLLVPSCGEDFSRMVREAVFKVICAQEQNIQVGSAVFHEACVLYLCNEAASSCDPAFTAHLYNLLQAGDLAVLKWLCERQEGEVPEELARIVKYALQDMLFSMLLSKGTIERWCLEGYVHVHRVCPQLTDLSSLQTQELQCSQLLLTFLESDSVAPQLRGHALCTVSLLLIHVPLMENVSVASRWLTALSKCADPAKSCETLRLAATHALELTGGKIVRQALKESNSGLSPLAVRAIVCGIDLLQDEERDVRESATKFALCVLDHPNKVTMQSDRALLHLLQLLRDRFWNCEETFHALLLRLPPCNLEAALGELIDRTGNLYEEDKPNVFADSMFLTSLLFPALCSLFGFISCSSSLCSAVLQWVENTATQVIEQIQRCHRWGKDQGSDSPFWLRASGCPRVHDGALGLFVHGKLLLRALETFSRSGVQISHLRFTSGCLKDELAVLQVEFKLHGIVGPYCLEISE